jgi:hypothetical protein
MYLVDSCVPSAIPSRGIRKRLLASVLQPLATVRAALLSLLLLRIDHAERGGACCCCALITRNKEAASNQPMATSHAPFQTLPDDLLSRLLVGLPVEDHRAAASVCKAFRDVINGSRFLDLRRRYGFAERGIATVKCVYDDGDGTYHSHIFMGHESDGTARINDYRVLPSTGSTTDGGSRLFVCTERPPLLAQGHPSQILEVDASSRRWRHIATLPKRNMYMHCMEWQGGLLYVAGGYARLELNTLYSFNEATGWEQLPPMPQSCRAAASGVIGNQLFITGGLQSSALQIYDIATKTWRFGAPHPSFPWPTNGREHGVVVDEKLFLFGSRVRGPLTEPENYRTLVYDPQSDTWTEEAPPWYAGHRVMHACAHDGTVVVFLENGTAFARAMDGAWSPCALAEREPSRRVDGEFFLTGSLLLG